MPVPVIERMASRLRWLIWAMMAFSVSVYLLAHYGLEIGGNPLLTAGAAGMLPPEVRVIRHVSAALALLAMWQLAGMLQLIMHGDRFSRAVARKLRQFALFLFASAVLSFAAGFVPLLGTDDRYPTFINLRELWYMMTTGGLFLVARLLDDAARIQAELAEIV